MKNNIVGVVGINRLRFGTDGEGIRTLVALYGCPLRCRYCINPQSWQRSTAAQVYTCDELYEAVKIDNLYFQSTHGGITFGGGEPLLYASFIEEFRQRCPSPWNLWAETSLNVPWENVRCCAAVVDHFIVDIKSLNPEVYRAYTGREFGPVLENLKGLLELVGPDRITVRVPLIPGYVDETLQMLAVTELQKIGIEKFDLFRYRLPSRTGHL